MPVGTYLYLHVVGAGSLLAVPDLARYGAKRGTGSCDPRDQSLLGSHVWGFWKSKYPYINTRISRSVCPICFFATNRLADTLPTRGRGRRVRNIFCRKGVRTDQRWDACVGVGGGQHRSVRVRRSLAVVHPCDFESPLGRVSKLRSAEEGRSRRSDTV
jgi:hypothetical protein